MLSPYLTENYTKHLKKGAGYAVTGLLVARRTDGNYFTRNCTRKIRLKGGAVTL
ncbi:MAG: hypothetical protein RL427_1547 [Bacteroidota bacterium]|jgi:hypothetical protein